MNYRRINIEDVDVMLNDADTVVVDIRDSASFQSSHFEGAINLTQNNLSQFITDTNKQRNILVVCYHGNSSKGAAEYLFEQGFQNVYSLDGGYEGWLEFNF